MWDKQTILILFFFNFVVLCRLKKTNVESLRNLKDSIIKLKHTYDQRVVEFAQVRNSLYFDSPIVHRVWIFYKTF
jgi:hypothetical protein